MKLGLIMSSFILNGVTKLGLSYLVPLFSRETINKTYNGITHFQRALNNNNHKTVARILQAGANIDVAKEFKSATIEKKLDLVHFFLKNGADPLKRASEAAYSPIELAFLSEDPSLIKIFSRSEKVSNLALAVGLSALKSVRRDRNFDLSYLESKKEQEVRRLADLFTQRKIAINALGLGNTLNFEGREFTKKQGFESPIMQEQQAEAYIEFLKEIGKPIDENDKQLIDYFNYKFITNYELPTSYELSRAAERIQKGDLEGVLTGYDGHASQIVFYKGYVALCNNNYLPWNGTLTVYKIDPTLVTDQDIRDLLSLQEKGKKDADEKLTEILDKWQSSHDDFCGYFDKYVIHKNQKAGNCTAKCGNIAKRFIQIMQLFPEKIPESNNVEQARQITNAIEKMVIENKRQSTFRKLFTLDQIAKKGNLQTEDKDWFEEALNKRITHWQNKPADHPFEAKMIAQLIDFSHEKFGARNL